MEIHERAQFYGTKLVDMRGYTYKVGDLVARGRSVGSSVEVEVVEVTRIEDGKMYVGGSKVAIRYPQRMLIVNAVYQ
jgi:hypothetical protein